MIVTKLQIYIIFFPSNTVLYGPYTDCNGLLGTFNLTCISQTFCYSKERRQKQTKDGYVEHQYYSKQ